MAVRMKSKMLVSVYYLISIVIICFCNINCNKALLKSTKEGYITKSLRIQYAGSDELHIPNYSYDYRVWYKGTYVIERISVIRIRESTESTLWKAEDLYYTFVDLANRNYFRYSSFVDTASMLQCCYTTNDSLGIEYGWNYFYCDTRLKQKKVSFLTDTSINGIAFRRAGFYKEDTLLGTKKLSQIYYLNKDRTDTTYTLNHGLTHEFKYPVTRVDYFTKNISTKEEMCLIEQINFEREKLTDTERKVFRKWIKNAKSNPVKYNAAKDSIYSPPISKER
jgi:hypothetical protein